MTLVDIGLDLQIAVFTFLRPSDILTLRKTCKGLQLATRQRIVWVEALHRVCLENKLFLPSFPIPDMSDLELEQAAIGPHRWIELSTSFSTQGPGDDKKLSPTTTRIIHNSLAKEDDEETDLFLVPGGRYLVGTCSENQKLGVWDLGYLSSADCKLIALVESGEYFGGIQATPDGMGLVIYTIDLLQNNNVYEIYPQSETPQLTKIALINNNAHPHYYGYLSPDKLIWSDLDSDKITVWVWDYRLNASTSFRAHVDVEKFDYYVDVRATQTAIILVNMEEILIWKIPPLSPELPNFSGDNPTLLPPSIRVEFPDGHELYPKLEPSMWKMMSAWYIDSSQPLYVDKIYMYDLDGSHLDRFKITIKPDLSDATLHFVNSLHSDEGYVICVLEDGLEDTGLPNISASTVCEDTLVSCWGGPDHCGIHTGSMLSRPTLHDDVRMSLPFRPARRSWESIGPICPASGRFVYAHDDHKIVVLDFLPQRRPENGLY